MAAKFGPLPSEYPIPFCPCRITLIGKDGKRFEKIVMTQAEYVWTYNQYFNKKKI